MIFESHSHQRFEGGIPKQELQTCNRAIQIDKNTNGCDGYRLTPGDGFIVSIINMDGDHPLWGDNYQMSPKPMRVVEKSTSHISLRGYDVLARTPFGYQSFDMSDYGITIFVEKDEIVKARLDMFDRNTYIEYYK
ncbi:MAG: hypothetical protein IJM66_10665 [Muribaculaceae bacterium]|nr:hypothetical protein [Muribaculaceae bacterium]